MQRGWCPPVGKEYPGYGMARKPHVAEHVALPQGWVTRTSGSSGKVYFYRAATDEITFDRPAVSAGTRVLDLKSA